MKLSPNWNPVWSKLIFLVCVVGMIGFVSTDVSMTSWSPWPWWLTGAALGLAAGYLVNVYIQNT